MRHFIFWSESLQIRKKKLLVTGIISDVSKMSIIKLIFKPGDPNMDKWDNTPTFSTHSYLFAFTPPRWLKLALHELEKPCRIYTYQKWYSSEGKIYFFGDSLKKQEMRHEHLNFSTVISIYLLFTLLII
jgi:hypothetical protein